jgi:hypothetical protein
MKKTPKKKTTQPKSGKKRPAKPSAPAKRPKAGVKSAAKALAAGLTKEDRRKFDELRKVVEQQAFFARQGSVVTSWRYRKAPAKSPKGGKKTEMVRNGPYYRLTWREGGVQKAIYMGSSNELAEAVRQLLAARQGKA